MERSTLIIIVILVVLLIVSNIATYFIASGTVTTVTQLSTVTSPTTVTSRVTVRETTTVTAVQTGLVTTTPVSPALTTPPYPTPPPPPSTEEILRMFPETIIIDQWDGLTGGDGYVYDDIVYMFQNYTQGRIQVRRTTVYWADLFARLVATWRAGDIESLPHLLLTHTEEIPLMMPFLAPLDDIAREAGFTRDMFDPIGWDRCIWGGKLLCLPWDIHPLLIYFRIDLAQKYGIKIPPPACEIYNLPCWDRSLDTLDDLWAWYKNEVKPKLPADIVPAGQQSWAWDMWGLFPKNPWAGKGTDENPQPEFTADYVVKVLRFFYDMGVNGIWKIVPWSDLANCLAGGQVFSWYNGPWMMASFDRIEGGCPYGAIPLLRKEGGTFGQLHNLEITVRATRDPKIMQAIRVFFQFIFQPEINAYWGIKAGHVPAVVAAQPIYIQKARELVGELGAKARQMWSFQVFEWGYKLQAHHELIYQINDILTTYHDSLIQATITPEEAAKTIQDEILKILEAWKAQAKSS